MASLAPLSPREGSTQSIHGLPVVEIRFSNLSHQVGVAVADSTPSNIFRQLARGACSLFRKTDRRKLGVLRDVSGVLRPGSSTLLLAAPGAGTSTFLRLLSGRTRPQDSTSITYNGVTQVGARLEVVCL